MLANISGKNPPRVVKDVVMICLVDLITTSIRSALVINDFLALSLIWDKTMIESFIDRPIRPIAPIVAMKPKFWNPTINPMNDNPIDNKATDKIKAVSLNEFKAKTNPIVIRKI